MGIVHSQRLGLGIHQGHKNVQATREGAAQRMGSAVLAGHERQVQHFATREGRAHRQARPATLFGIHIILGDRDRLIHGQLRLGDQHARHELGQRRNWKHRLIVLAQQDLVRVLVYHQRHAGLEIQRVIDFVQTRHLTKRRLGRHIRHLGGCFGRAGGKTGGLDAGGHLALGDDTFGAGGTDLLLFGTLFFDSCRVCGRGNEGSAHERETHPLEKSIHCSVAAMVHQSAPNGKNYGAVYRIKKSRARSTPCATFRESE